MSTPEPDLSVVDDLCRLVLIARRLGCRVRLECTDDVRSLLDLAGVAAVVTGQTDDRGGRP